MATIARCSLLTTSIASLSYALPPNLTGCAVEQGLWSPATALSRARRPQGGYPGLALSSLAPWLDGELALRALADSAHDDRIYDLGDAEGLGAVAARLAELGRTRELRAALLALPPSVRALVAAVAWRRLPGELWPPLGQWVIEGAAQVSHCSQAASTAFAALPIIAEAERANVVQRALDRLYDEDFGLDPEHAALLGAAGLWQHGVEQARRDSMPYPRQRMYAHVAPYVPAAQRRTTYEQWFEAYQHAAQSFSLLSLEIPRLLDDKLARAVLAFVRAAHKRGDLGAVRPLVKLSYELPAIRAEARAAVEGLGGADGPLARLSLCPVLPPPEADALAQQAYRQILSLLDSHAESSLAERDQYWPREPGFMPWTYIGPRRPGPVLAVAALRFLQPSPRARCTRELFSRFNTIGDADAVLATAATTVAALPEPERAAFFTRLCQRLRPDEDNPVTLARLAALTTGPRRVELVEAAWRGRLAPDTEALVGEALSRTSAFLAPERLAPLQLTALQRWSSGPRKPNWSALLPALRGVLSAPALQWLLAQELDEHTAASLLPYLPEDAQQREAARLLQRNAGLSFFWHVPELVAACRYAKNAGELLHARLEADGPRLPGPFRLGGPPGEVGGAYALQSLLAAGHRHLAESLRATLRTPSAQLIADLAFIRHAPAAERESQLARALERLPSDSPVDLIAYDAALEWFPPLGLLPTIVACARRLPTSDWLRFAQKLQAHGHLDTLRLELTPDRLAALGTDCLLLDPELWLPQASPELALQCWLHHFRSQSSQPRRQLLAGSQKSWFHTLAAVAEHAGGSAVLSQLAQAVLDVGERFS